MQRPLSEYISWRTFTKKRDFFLKRFIEEYFYERTNGNNYILRGDYVLPICLYWRVTHLLYMPLKFFLLKNKCNLPSNIFIFQPNKEFTKYHVRVDSNCSSIIFFISLIATNHSKFPKIIYNKKTIRMMCCYFIHAHTRKMNYFKQAFLFEILHEIQSK